MIKEPLYKNVRAVRVKWIDSTHSSGWIHDHKDSDLECVTVGLLVDRTEKRLKIALSASVSCYAHFIEIPMCAVKSIRRVKIP